jgi:Capsular polysaccharide biosynthesis protein
MRLYLGSELYASENMISQIKDKRAMPMAGSNYVLTELYEAITASQVRAYLGILISKGYRPVIAHAERYGCMRNDINFIEDMIEMGAYIQLNADSVIGKEGFDLKKILLKNF